MEMAKSLSGHDKEQLYVVIRGDGEFVYLVNGVNRTLEKPKKKNRKHIQIIECLSRGVTDLTAKRAIKLYEQNM